jgi:hypothetical protein
MCVWPPVKMGQKKGNSPLRIPRIIRPQSNFFSNSKFFLCSKKEKWKHLVSKSKLRISSGVVGPDRSNQDHIAGSGSGSASRACRSGSVSISTKCNDKLCFFQKISMFCPKYKNLRQIDKKDMVLL